MKSLLILLFSASSAFALPLNSEQVKERLGAKNAISFSVWSLAEGNLPKSTCVIGEFVSRSAGAYIVQDRDYKTKIFYYNGTELTDCGEL